MCESAVVCLKVRERGREIDRHREINHNGNAKSDYQVFVRHSIVANL